MLSSSTYVCISMTCADARMHVHIYIHIMYMDICKYVFLYAKTVNFFLFLHMII